MTSERKTPWTPGPWTYDSGLRIAAGSVPVGIVAPFSAAAANARLIAEAPAMAELLGQLTRWWADDSIGQPHALAKTVADARVLLARIGAAT